MCWCKQAQTTIGSSLGSEASASTPVDIAEEFDCDLYSVSAPVTSEFPEDHPYLVSCLDFAFLVVLHACPWFQVFCSSSQGMVCNNARPSASLPFRLISRCFCFTDAGVAVFSLTSPANHFSSMCFWTFRC